MIALSEEEKRNDPYGFLDPDGWYSAHEIDGITYGPFIVGEHFADNNCPPEAKEAILEFYRETDSTCTVCKEISQGII
jgi:hypothetical protein